MRRCRRRWRTCWSLTPNNLKAVDTRHLQKEGNLLRELRQACRRHVGREDPSLETGLRRLGDIWLAFTKDRDDAGDVEPAMLDYVVEECLEEARRLTTQHAEASQMPSVAKEGVGASWYHP